MTAKQIKDILKQEGITPRKRLGQNFLINRWLAEKIAEAVQKYPPPYVEIGPGFGALTNFFPKKDILLIERDKKLASYWEKKGFSVHCQDALKYDFTQLPHPFVLFGNLPYSLAGPLIIRASACKSISKMIFMMQKEVALRVKGLPPSKNYGLLSVISQAFWKISLIGNADIKDFHPQPKVKGQVLEFTRRESDFKEPERFIQFIKLCFINRRKKLVKQIPLPSVKEAENILEKANQNLNVRAGELTPKDFIHLYNLAFDELSFVLHGS